MQIKVRPEVPGNEDGEFQLEWARAISAAEEILSSCIVRHFMEQIDRSIYDKIKSVLGTLQKSGKYDNPE